MRIERPNYHKDTYDYELNTHIILEDKTDILNFITEKGLSLSEAKDLVREFKDKGEVVI